MRIAILSSGFPPTGGGGVAAAHFNLYNALRGLGHDARVFTFGDDVSAPVPPGGGVVRSGPLPAWIIGPLYDMARWLWLRGERGRAFQLSDTFLAVPAGRRAFGRIRRFRPELLIVPDHGAPSAWFGRIPGCTVLFVSHHNAMRFLEEPLIGPFSIPDARLAHRIERRALRRADGAVCPSESMREAFLRTYAFPGPVRVIPNLIDLATLARVAPADPRAEHGLAPGSPVVYVPSAGSPFKGSRYVFEIVRRLALGLGGEIGFYLSGRIDPVLARELEHLPDNARVIAPGRLPYEANIARVKACDLCVSPTLVESFGMALAEAQACGLPCVSFDVGGNRDVVEEGATGHRVPLLDIEALLARSLALLADAPKRRDMGARGRKRVETRFDPDALARAYLEAAEAARSSGGGAPA